MTTPIIRGTSRNLAPRSVLRSQTPDDVRPLTFEQQLVKLPATQIEEDFGHVFSDLEWEAINGMDAIAEALANHCCLTIGERVENLPNEPMRYKAQWTLEKLIEKLQARV